MNPGTMNQKAMSVVEFPSITKKVKGRISLASQQLLLPSPQYLDQE